MQHNIIVAGTVGFMVLMVIVLVITIFSATMGATQRVENRTADMSLGESAFFGEDFYIVNVHFYNRSLAEGNFDSNMSICDKLVDDEIVIMKAWFNNTRLPDKCDIMVDGAYDKTLDIRDLSCRPLCKGTETILVIDISATSIWKQHDVQLCCDSLCLKKILRPLCRKKF